MLELHEKSGIVSLALVFPSKGRLGLQVLWGTSASGTPQIHPRERGRQIEIHNPGITFKMQCWRCLLAHTLGT